MALVRVSVPRDIFVTSGSSRYARIAAIATGIRIGWRKLMTLAPAQITAATMTARTTTKQAVNAAHIILRCQSVGYSFISQHYRNVGVGCLVSIIRSSISAHSLGGIGLFR